MARVRSEDWHDAGPARKRRSGGWLGWLLAIVLLLGCGAFVYFLYLPLRHTRAQLDGDLAAAAQREQAMRDQLKRADGRLAKLEDESKKISGELAETVAEKERVEAELKRVQGELSQKLNPEIETGNVHIDRRGQQLVVNMSDQILFETGEADVSETGRKVLAQIAQSLAALTGYDIQVGGHTDSEKVVSPATRERFPTNWELSTTRATNVVRYLQEHGKIPGRRLIAAGFAQFRPTASNKTEAGRQKNRRIEIVLVPRAREDRNR